MRTMRMKMMLVVGCWFVDSFVISEARPEFLRAYTGGVLTGRRRYVIM